MYCRPILDFFLGALSPAGFTGWFAQAAAEPGQTYLIKAGPGCGKSTLMRRLGEADARQGTRGDGAMEHLHCSSDPDSLDGVRLSGASALVLDATAPHTLDCVYPGAAERVISLYDTLDNAALLAHRAEILALGARNRQLLQQAAAHYALACALLARRRAMAFPTTDKDAVRRFTARLAARTIPPQRAAAPGLQRHRLLSAPTPGGPTVFYNTIAPLAAGQLYAIHDPYGAVGGLMLAQLAAYARENGYEAYLCHCPTDQRSKLDHLFIPALGLGFVTSNPWHPMRFAWQKNLHASRFMDHAALAGDRGVLNDQRRIAAGLIKKTCAVQARAKAAHDALEQYYVAAADFTAVDAVRAKLETFLFPAP